MRTKLWGRKNDEKKRKHEKEKRNWTSGWIKRTGNSPDRTMLKNTVKIVRGSMDAASL
jgi:hypothetical protein